MLMSTTRLLNNPQTGERCVRTSKICVSLLSHDKIVEPAGMRYTVSASTNHGKSRLGLEIVETTFVSMGLARSGCSDHLVRFWVFLIICCWPYRNFLSRLAWDYCHMLGWKNGKCDISQFKDYIPYDIHLKIVGLSGKTRCDITKSCQHFMN